MREENDFRGRVDGLTSRQELGIVRRLMKDKRWKTDQNGLRQKCVDTAERVLDDKMLHPLLHLKAVDLVLKMEAQNMVDERMEMGDGVGENDGPQVILVLPCNGSELQNVEQRDDHSEDTEGDEGSDSETGIRRSDPGDIGDGGENTGWESDDEGND